MLRMQGRFRKSAQSDEATELKREIAAGLGWPSIKYYDPCHCGDKRLQDVPGSFVAEETPNGCPVSDPIHRAYLDMLPALIRDDYEGQWLVFGYGRNSYVLGPDPEAASVRLMEEYPYEMPYVFGTVSISSLRTPSAIAYYKWVNEQHFARRAPVVG